jgi:uncharacterized protein (TIGR00255 family)
MTGCGYGRIRKEGWEITAEIRTVNHRFLDIGMRLPRNIGFLEQSVRTRMSERLRRGHADVFLTVRSVEESAMSVEADYDLAAHYSEIAREMSRRTGTENDMTVSRLMTMEGVTTVTEREMDREKITVLCGEALDQAIDQLIGMREKEGEHLKEDLRIHLQETAKLREKVLARAPHVVEEYREKLEARLKALITDGVDPVRLAQEVAIAADRCAIDEELARLESHIRQMETYLEETGEIGKKMDFLIQEMNRETNTIGSKASDAQIARVVVDLKSEIEKMREQIQNVE